MDTRNHRDSSAHSIAFHEQQLPLFDAYMTNELDEDEKTQVEQHLKSCQECQHLFNEVTHFRYLLGTRLQPAESFTSAQKETTHSSSIIHAVMECIEQKGKKGDHSAPLPTLTARKRVPYTYLRIVAAVLCLFLLVSLLATIQHTLNTSSSKNGPMSVPAPIVWTTQQSMLVQNSAGVLAIKEIEITTQKEFRFYYVFQSSHQGTIHVTAASSLNTTQTQPIILSATVQSLGIIDGFSVGVIRVHYLDRAGQTIALRITSSGSGNASWQLTPLKQLIAEPHPEGGSFYSFPIDQHLFSEIIWSGPISGVAGPSQQSMVAYFKNAASTHYIFLQVDYAGEVAVITKEECVQLVGAQNCQ